MTCKEYEVSASGEAGVKNTARVNFFESPLLMRYIPFVLIAVSLSTIAVVLPCTTSFFSL